MKKIYLLLVGLSFCGAVLAQEGVQAEGGSLPFKPHKNARPEATSTSGDARATNTPKPFAYWVDPVGDMIYNKGIGIYDADDAKNLVGGGFVTPLFVDSTVKYENSNASLSTVRSCFVGSILDAQSQYLLEQGGGAPIVSPADSYDLDSLQILMRYYMKDTTKHDSLFIWLQWGKPDDAAVFNQIPSADLWGTDFAGFRAKYTAAKVKGAGGTPGPVVVSDAPSTNYKLIKYPLEKSDTVLADGYAILKLLKVSGVKIPAGNILALYMTYVPEAGSTKLGDVFYSFATPKKNNVNGFGVHLWQQKGVTKTSDFKDYMVDPSTPHASGLNYSRSSRYGTFTVGAPNVYSIPTFSPIISYKISGLSTVGINQLHSNFSLEQNVPNPFNNETTISYSLKTSAKNVSVVVYNVAGVKVFESNQGSAAAGRYSVKVNSSNLAAGVYFYSLIVDGNRATNKMVVTE